MKFNVIRHTLSNLPRTVFNQPIPDSPKPRSWVRFLLKIMVALFVIAILSGIAGYFWLRTSLPKIDGTLKLSGLSAPVDITRNEHGVPYIKAGNMKDAVFALGFVHAQDRLWQMDMMRRLGSGRLSEVVGKSALSMDKYMRFMGFSHLAEKFVDDLDPALRSQLDAYAAGVNAYIDGHSGAWPAEYYVLGFRPEPWRLVDTVMWGKIMALHLAHNWKDELLRARMEQKLPAELVAKLWPGNPIDSAITLKNFLPSAEKLQQLSENTPKELGGEMASNIWVVSGEHSETGKPLLANDPHLSLSMPSQWYLAKIITPEVALTGATAPGAPFMILGHNQHISWGFTTTTSDVQDLFIEKLSSEDPTHYVTPDGTQSFVTREETIKIKGQDSVKIAVRSTRHGVVISDLRSDSADVLKDDEVLVLAWPGLYEGDMTSKAIFDLNFAKNWQEFTEALKNFHAPQQNVFYADVDGNIGFYAPAKVPIRKGGNGLLPVPGWSGEYDWSGYIPFEELPHSYNPKQGWLVNANNQIVDEDYSYHISFGFENPASRADRIEQLLASKDKHSLKSFANIQYDYVSLMALDVVKLLEGVITDIANLKRMLDLMKNWDGSMDRNRPEPLFFTAWLYFLHKDTITDVAGDFTDNFLWWRPTAIKNVIAQGINSCTKKLCTDRVSLAAERAFIMLCRRFGDNFHGWKYGEMHSTHLSHNVFGRIPLVRSITDVDIPTNGGKYTVNEATAEMRKDILFKQAHGPGFRGIYDLSNLNDSWFMMTPGQSGNPFSKDWANYAKPWADGKYIKLGELPSNPRGTLVLKPA
jgi:penicillin G amidase